MKTIPFDLGPDLRLAQPNTNEDYAVLAEVLALIRLEDNPGWGLEFGVATGTTLAMIAKAVPVIGFDSFEGLPEDWRDGFPAGHFAGVRPLNEIPNTTLVEGLFEDTVPGYDWPEKIALVHIDCDLYSSTKTVLNSLAGALHPGTYIVFDEFFGYPGAEQHEQRAWYEFAAKHGLAFQCVGYGREQVAFRIIATGYSQEGTFLCGPNAFFVDQSEGTINLMDLYPGIPKDFAPVFTEGEL